VAPVRHGRRDDRNQVISIGSKVTFLIGRTDVVVPDPYYGDRERVEPFADELDDLATLFGVSLVDWTDRELTDRLRGLESGAGRLAPWLVDALARSRVRLLAEDRLFAAQEDVLALQAMLGSTRSQNLAHALDEARRTELLVKEVLSDVVRAGFGDIQYQDDGDGNVGGRHHTVRERLRAWIEAESGGQGFALRVALRRELALRAALRAPEGSKRYRAEVPRNVGVKPVGADGPVLLAEARLQANGWNRILGRGESPLLARDVVPTPPLLDHSFEVLGRTRRAELAASMGPLVEWIGQRPDHWVRRRNSELRRSPIPDLNRAARQVGEYQAMAAGIISQRDANRERAERSAAKNPEQARRAALSASWFDGAFQTMRHLLEMPARAIEDQLASPQGRGFILWLAYRYDGTIRERQYVMQGARRSLETPSRGVLNHLGARPQPGRPERDEWNKLAEHLERRRLEDVAAGLDGVDPPSRDPEKERALAERIASYRADRGMAPVPPNPAARAQVAVDGPGYG
jgi:hypothetical protein